MKHSNKWYVAYPDGFKECIDGKRLKNNLGLDLFYYYNKKYAVYRVCDGKTGYFIFAVARKENIMARLEELGDKIIQELEAKQLPLSPRYTAPSDNKPPRPKNTDLYRVFNFKTRKSMIKYDDVLWVLKKNTNGMFYVLDKGWMIPVCGNADRARKFLEENPDIEKCLRDELEKQKEKGNVDKYLKRYLGIDEYLKNFTSVNEP